MSDLLKRMKQQSRKRSRVQQETLSFDEYVQEVKENPQLAETAHQRVYRMIVTEGFEPAEEDDEPKSYNFFSEELYGIDDVIETMVEDYFKAAARNMDVRKRMLLLMGPPGGGKSTMVNLLKEGLENFSLTEEGASYQIKDCPMQDNPVNLVPSSLRKEFEEELSISIEGDVCPRCRWQLDHEYDGDPSRFKVERLVFDENARKGIGTFVPSDPKNQDISELVGSVNISKLSELTESDPRAYQFDGALNVANRGIMEFIEVFKAETEFLNKLITLCEEKVIKSPRFPLIHADEVVISHTNETEYNRFMSDPQNEALRNRIKVVKVPYNLRLDSEVKIYEKLIRQSSIEQGEEAVHISPHTLEAAGHYAIMTRLGMKDPDELKLVVKALNEEEVGNLTDEDIKELIDKTADNAGMFGLSPRNIIDAIASASMEMGRTALFFTDVLKELMDLVDEHLQDVPNVTREQLESYIVTTRGVIDDKIKSDVQEAFVLGFEDSARQLFENYLDNIKAYCSDETIRDPVTADKVDPNEDLMRSIEEQIGVSKKAKDGFREQIIGHIGNLTIEEKTYDWTTVSRLKEAIEAKLFDQVKDFIRISTDTTRQDEEAERRLNQAVEKLVEQRGYNTESAEKAVQYVGQILN